MKRALTSLALAAALCFGAAGAASCGGASAVGGAVDAPADGAEGGATSDDAGGTNDGAGSIAPDGGPVPSGADSVSIIVEPSDKAGALLAAVQGATKSVHMTMYLLDDARFIDALIARHAAGRDVKVILNKSFPQGAGTNQKAFNTLQAAGVSVVWAPPTFTLTHEKTVIVDGASAWIMTMNLAVTSSQNREFLALDTDPADVNEAEAIFAADFGNTAIVPLGNLVVSPVNSRDRLVQLIESAKSTVDLEGEELSDYKVVDTLAAAVKAGVTVRVVLSDNAPSAAQSAAVAQLKAAGAHLVSVGKPYIHAKALVADGALAYVGSENFTAASLQHNRELGIVTANAASVTTITKVITQDFASGAPL